jgi:hypothetical protein
MMLDPSWLKQFPKDRRQEMFFRSVLPILTLKVYQTPRKANLIACDNHWAETFASPQFDVSKALHEFNKDRLQNATSLSQYLILKWARLMHQKLWTRCGECYLLGLAYKSWQQTAERDPGSYSSMSRMHCLDDVYQDLQTVPNIELSDSEDEVSEDDHLTHIFQTTATDANMPQSGELQADVTEPEMPDQIGSSAEDLSKSRSLVFGKDISPDMPPGNFERA